MPSPLDLPIPLADIESVLAWVDTYKLSRPTKKINRDFSDAVLLAEILGEHYPKLVEMHNYPPRNSHALKLNNWMTLNRKVLKKLKLNLCCNTMEQLANCAPGVIERVLVMVREKIQKDDEANKSMKDAEQNVSSGGSYYEACGDDENVLVVPVKTRVNGILETIQQKVVNHQSYLNLKEELKDATDTADLLKQKVEHLDNLLKLKEQRIEELQKQLERKQSRRKEVDALQNSLSIQFDTNLLLTKQSDTLIRPASVTPSARSAESLGKISLKETMNFIDKIQTNVEPKASKSSYIIMPNTNTSQEACELKNDVDRIKSDVFKEAQLIVENNNESCQDREEFIDTEPVIMATIEDVIQKELNNIINPSIKEKELVNTSAIN